jgi:dTDP-4-dehydrorhamnose reductase
VHLDSYKLFKPCLINNICDVFVHYIEHDLGKQIIINLGVDKATTYYDFLIDVAKTLELKTELIKPDGEEITWSENSTLSIEKMKELHYPVLTYNHLLQTLKKDWEA